MKLGPASQMRSPVAAFQRGWYETRIRIGCPGVVPSTTIRSGSTVSRSAGDGPNACSGIGAGNSGETAAKPCRSAAVTSADAAKTGSVSSGPARLNH